MCGSEELIHDARQVDLEEMIMTNETPMYLVPGRLTDKQKLALQKHVDAYDFDKALEAIGTPIQPCADVETVGWQVIRTGDGFPLEVFRSSEMAEWVGKAIKKPVDAVPLVRRTDMEAQVARVAAEKDAEIARLREALLCARDAIMSGRNNHSIVCTIWAADGETLVDRIDDALNEGAAG